jgi:hypothetical protein
VKKPTSRPAVIIQVGDNPTDGERMIVGRFRSPSPLGKTLIVEFHFRHRAADDESMGRNGYRVAFFELDDDEATSLGEAILSMSKAQT